MKFWVVNLCKDCIDKSRWKNNLYKVPKSVELTESDKFNLHELHTYDRFKWMAESKSIGVTAPFYEMRCSFGDQALLYNENAEEEEILLHTH